MRSCEAWLIIVVLSLLVVVPAFGFRYTAVIDYPPLKYQPSSMVVDDSGHIWFAMPQGRAVALYVPGVGVNLIDVEARVSDLAYGHGVVVAYEAGSSDVVFIDAASGRVLSKSVESGYVDAIVPVDGGFVLVKNFPTMTMLVHVSPGGEILWESKISDKQLERYRPAAGSGKYVWLRTVEGNLLLIELGREGYKEYRLEKKPIVLASRDGKVWAVDSEGGVTRLSIRGVEARLNTGSKVMLGDPCFALPGDRLVILSRIDGVVTEISDGQASREALQNSFTLAALKGVAEVYMADASEKSILVASFSRQPTIYDASATPVGDGGVIRVTARVSDPDGDLAEGYPRVVGVLGTDTSIQQMSLVGDVYSADLAVPKSAGVLKVYVQVMDAGGNEARLEVASYQVSGGRVTGVGPATATPPPSQGTSNLSSLFPFAVEMTFFIILVTVLVVVWLGRSRRGRRRRR
ncbi:MAG: hypothetical protein QXR28_03005 [Nitrososphaerota archaeon]